MTEQGTPKCKMAGIVIFFNLTLRPRLSLVFRCAFVPVFVLVAAVPAPAAGQAWAASEPPLLQSVHAVLPVSDPSAALEKPVETAVTPGNLDGLVDAPSAVLQGSSEPSDVEQTNALTQAPTRRRMKFDSEMQRNTDCENGILRGKRCRVSWSRLLGESFFFLSAQHGGNIWMDAGTRDALLYRGGGFWGKYVQSVEGYRWWRWKDDDPFGVNYIGHPMMGAVTSSMYEQNDPKQRALSYENTRCYWVGRLRATAYSAAYSAQWKVGPVSEASIGNSGMQYYVRQRDGVWTNETGMQDFFVTPIGGLAWNVGEDMIDRYILRHVRHGTRNKALLFLSGFSTPGKSAANLSRFRAVYYRDLDVDSVIRQAR